MKLKIFRIDAMIRLMIFTGLLIYSFIASSQNIWSGFEHLVKPVRGYVVYKTISQMEIDGKGEELSWQKAQWSEYFNDIEGDLKPVPTYKTRFKMLWDEKYVYLLAELEEPHIWSYYTKRDQIVFHENDFEIFIDPDADTHNYFEFELNAQNTLFDLFMRKPYRNGQRAEIEWNMNGFRSAVHIDGTINNPEDIDEKWTVEVAIPINELTANGIYSKAEDGQYWKINFSRVQWKTEIIDGKYSKLKDKKSNKFLREDNWVWSPQGIINMHYPERWGIALFTSNKVDGEQISFQVPLVEKYNRYIWLVYYKQIRFRGKNGRYAYNLSELGLPEEISNETGEIISYDMKVNDNRFTVILKTREGMELSLNQDGLFKSKIK